MSAALRQAMFTQCPHDSNARHLASDPGTDRRSVQHCVCHGVADRVDDGRHVTRKRCGLSVPAASESPSLSALQVAPSSSINTPDTSGRL